MTTRHPTGLRQDNSGGSGGSGGSDDSGHPRQENSLANTFFTYTAAGAGIGLGLVAAGFVARSTGISGKNQ